ncbi:unnamed protein product [Urochloa humidicola]
MISKPLLLASSILLLLLTWLLSPSRRRRIPSPPALPIIGHLHLLKKPLHRSLAALAKRYAGDDAGLLHLKFGARPVLLVTSPAIAGECFATHDVALADRPGLASRRILTGDLPAIGMCNYGPVWRQLRRLATVHALCTHRLTATAAARDAGARTMAARLCVAAAGGSGPAVAVKAAAYEFVVGVIMTMVSGERSMPEEQMRRFKEMTEAGLAAAGAANRQDFLPVMRLLDLGRTAKKLAAIAGARNQFGQSLIDDYRRRHASEQETPRTTVLGDLLRLQQEGSPEPLDDAIIRSVCLSLLQAGTDTSSSTIEWAMALLLDNLDVLKKVTTRSTPSLAHPA